MFCFKMAKYFEFKVEQGSNDWFKIRNKLWLTGSNVGSAVGHCKYKSPEELMDEIVRQRLGEKKPPPNAAMLHGTLNEPIVREWYCQQNNITLVRNDQPTETSVETPIETTVETPIETTVEPPIETLVAPIVEGSIKEIYCEQNNVKMIETGVIIPRWNTDIGGSVDGLVGDEGMIEIKCPQRMYLSLIDQTSDYLSEEEKKVGMPMYHFDQIQFYLNVLERKWCDYVVRCGGDTIIKRVLRNQVYWNGFLYPKILKFVEDTKKMYNQRKNSK
jgi:YqaJ-like viral recombinase domain